MDFVSLAVLVGMHGRRISKEKTNGSITYTQQFTPLLYIV